MNNNTFDFKEFQDAALKFVNEKPAVAFLSMMLITGLAKGVSDGISKLGPHIENVGKYAVDKAVERLPKFATQPNLADGVTIAGDYSPGSDIAA